jgi:hypothetical protein
MRKPGPALLSSLLPAALLILSGCGAVDLSRATGSGLVIEADRSALDTTVTDQLRARLSSGAPAAVKWSIAGGQNDRSLGQGSISQAGVYSPPSLLSRDQVQVLITATLASAPSTTASYLLTVSPGFVQVVSPETASLPPGGSVQVTGQIAEVNAGAVRWTLSSSPSRGTDPGDSYGSLSETVCRHSPRTYTTCTTTYTAPRSLPAGSPSVYVVGLAAGNARSAASLHVLLNGEGFSSSPLENQEAQKGYVEMGSSGGNANDYDSRKDASGREYVNDCCGGTLGALVTDHSGNLYILSNNHVLAESDHGRAGDLVVQPALVDLNCNPQAGRTIGALRYFVPLKSSQTNVDAALAAATPAVDGTGAILQLGPALNGSLTPGPPAAGSGEALTANLLNQLQVAKSGRTTGLTCSTVSTVNLSVAVDYYDDCAETQPYYTKIYSGQIGIPGLSFADSGDSGSLVVDAGNAEAVGLLFATGADDTGEGFSVASPIQEVLSELGKSGQAEGLSFEIAGGAEHPVTCSNFDAHSVRPSPALGGAELQNARGAAELGAAHLVRPGNGILGTAAGSSLDRPGTGAVLVYVDRSKPLPAVPPTIGGVRTVIIATDAVSMNAGTEPTTLSRAEGIHLNADVLRTAAGVQRQYAPQLMADPAFFGVGVSQSYDNPNEAALLILVDLTKTPRAMPDVVGGLRVRYLRLHRLHVTRSKFSPGVPASSCGKPLLRGQ